MEVKNRIIEIMEKSGLTPSEFADKIEVQRSAISHITSGRNKPSLEFLIKIKSAFPEIDTDWLIFGTEKEDELEEYHQENELEEKTIDFHPTLFDVMDNQEIHEKTQIVEEKKESRTNQSGKKLVKLMLLYEDGSFEEFNPS